jgi:hypothetical protein
MLTTTLEKDRANAKMLGAVYTPEHVVRYMLDQLKPWGSGVRVLEPSGGDGAFVRPLIEHYDVRSRDITVWDINPKIKDVMDDLGVNFVLKDSLLQVDLGQLSFAMEKYTHIIGNPPYLNKQSEYIKRNKGVLKKKYQAIGANDTYAMFIYMAAQHLERGGRLSFIISDTYRTLGIHKKLRYWLLKNMRLDSITLCPLSLFQDKGVSVTTSILTITNIEPAVDHEVVINDCRDNILGDYLGKEAKIRQLEFLSYPDYVINNIDSSRSNMGQLMKLPKLVEFLDGGLGMYTTDNKKFIYSIDYHDNTLNTASKYGGNEVSVKEIDGTRWRVYHKRGGNLEYYSRPRYAIRWDADSRAKYKGFRNEMIALSRRPGFVISGVCSELSARFMMADAMWESNKAMCFFPKDPTRYSPEFFIGILNSQYYRSVAKIFNHTSSLQIRDIKKLPMLQFSVEDVARITILTRAIILRFKGDGEGGSDGERCMINAIVEKYDQRPQN